MQRQSYNGRYWVICLKVISIHQKDRDKTIIFNYTPHPTVQQIRLNHNHDLKFQELSQLILAIAISLLLGYDCGSILLWECLSETSELWSPQLLMCPSAFLEQTFCLNQSRKVMFLRDLDAHEDLKQVVVWIQLGVAKDENHPILSVSWSVKELWWSMFLKFQWASYRGSLSSQ